MAKRKSRASKSQGSQRNQLRRLRDLGLYRGDTSKVSDYGKRQIKKFGDVLTGQAKAVQVRSPIAARKYSQFKTKYRTVVIPRQPGERVFYNKVSGEIFSYRQQYGQKIKRIIPSIPGPRRKLKKGERVSYAIPIGGPDHYERFDTWEELETFMKPYQSTHLVTDKYGVRPVSYQNWKKYVEIEIIEGDDE